MPSLASRRTANMIDTGSHLVLVKAGQENDCHSYNIVLGQFAGIRGICLRWCRHAIQPTIHITARGYEKRNARIAEAVATCRTNLYCPGPTGPTRTLSNTWSYSSESAEPTYVILHSRSVSHQSSVSHVAAIGPVLNNAASASEFGGSGHQHRLSRSLSRQLD